MYLALIFNSSGCETSMISVKKKKTVQRYTHVKKKKNKGELRDQNNFFIVFINKNAYLGHILSFQKV